MTSEVNKLISKKIIQDEEEQSNSSHRILKINENDIKKINSINNNNSEYS